jgi:hypothetical protein
MQMETVYPRQQFDDNFWISHQLLYEESKDLLTRYNNA